MKLSDRRVLAPLVGAQAVSCLLAWRDLAKRPAEEVRGSKNLWRFFVTINPANSIVYWLAGRR